MATLRSTIRRAKESGISAQQVWELIQKTRTDNAKKQGWRPSELAATLVDDQDDLIAVYGTRATTFLGRK